MARCQCGGSGCQCVVQAGDGTTVTGTGSTPNPYIVSANPPTCDQIRPCLSDGPGVVYDPGTGVIGACLSTDAGNNLAFGTDGCLYCATNCAEVRQCLSAEDGATYDPATGTIRTCLSTDPGNNITYGTDGCLFVPAGAATVTAGCGLTGNGSAATPIRVNTAVWPYACDIAANGGAVACDPATGQLRGAPPVRTAWFGQGFNATYPSVSVPFADTTVQTISLTVTNPDPCRQARVLIARMIDVDFTLPPGAAATSILNGDDMNYLENGGTSTVTTVHGQHPKIGDGGIIPAGGSTTFTLTIGVGRGKSGAAYTRIQADIQAWLWSDPTE